MAKKKVTNRQKKKMKKLQEKRQKAENLQRKQELKEAEVDLKTRTKQTIEEMKKLTDAEQYVFLSNIMTNPVQELAVESSKNYKFEVSRKANSKKSSRGKRVKVDITSNRTISRVYRSAMQNVKLVKSKYYVFLIFYIALFTIYFTSNTLSRYSGEVSKNGSLEVAKWEVEAIGQNSKTINMVSGDNGTYTITVRSASETACNYSIKLSNLPNDISVKLDSGITKTPINGEIVFNDVGSFNANLSGSSRNHTITFITTLETAAITGRQVTVDVSFVQVEI